MIGAFGLWGVYITEEHLDSLYTHDAQPIAEMGAMNGTLGKILADMLLAWQHNPTNPLSVLHNDHPVTMHYELAATWQNIFETHWAAYLAAPLTPEERELAEVIDKSYKGFMAEGVVPFQAAMKSGNFSPEVMGGLLATFPKYAVTAEVTLAKLMELSMKQAKQDYEESKASYENTRVVVIAITLIGILLAVFTALSIVRSITKPLSRIQHSMQEIETSGDFTHRVELEGTDEVAQCAASFNKLLASLQETFKNLASVVVSLDQSSGQLQTTAEQTTENSQLASESTASMASAIEEMTASTKTVQDSAQETKTISNNNKELAANGGTIIQKTVEEMQAMAEVVRQSSGTIAELSKQSEQITSIVQVIKDVADQTNLLALNAAIEAARAGEQGRGFAVVADEVRKLAERTTSATGEISAMITAIQESSQQAVNAMKLADERVNSGVELAAQASSSIADINAASGQAEARVAEITDALTGQVEASQHISQQVERAAQAAEENSAAAANVSETATHIATLAHSAREAMARFKV
jgi:methyl-accepting chemotaxis protein